MTAPAKPSAYGRWRDIEGIHIALLRWVEQGARGAEAGMLPSRLRQQRQVVGRGLDSFHYRFVGNELVSVPHQLLRLLLDTPGEC